MTVGTTVDVRVLADGTNKQTLLNEMHAVALAVDLVFSNRDRHAVSVSQLANGRHRGAKSSPTSFSGCRRLCCPLKSGQQKRPTCLLRQPFYRPV